MTLGDRVIAYTHEASDTGPDVVRDELAFVVGLVDEEEKCIDVVIFPRGGPLRWERLCQFDQDYLYNVAGGHYWRGAEEEAPNFDEVFPYSANPEWNALIAKQIAERDAAPNQEALDKLVDKHTREQEELAKKLDERYAEKETK